MYRIIKIDGTELGITDSVNYIRYGDGGCFTTATRKDAIGVAFKSVAYNLVGHEDRRGGSAVAAHLLALEVGLGHVEVERLVLGLDRAHHRGQPFVGTHCHGLAIDVQAQRAVAGRVERQRGEAHCVSRRPCGQGTAGSEQTGADEGEAKVSAGDGVTGHVDVLNWMAAGRGYPVARAKHPMAASHTEQVTKMESFVPIPERQSEA